MKETFRPGPARETSGVAQTANSTGVETASPSAESTESGAEASSDRPVVSAPQTQCEDDPGFTVIDRRFWTQPESDDAAPQADVQKERVPSYVGQLEAELAKRDQQLREYIEAHKTTMRESEAARQRLQRDLKANVEREKGNIIAQFFEVFDNLTRSREAAEQAKASASVLAGLDMVIGQFQTKLQELGVRSLNPLGEPFDPHAHEALALMPCSEPAQDNQVMQVVKTGFLYGDRVLRAALVIVGRTAAAVH